MKSKKRVDPVFFPQGVADPEGRVAVVATAAGGVDAIDLQDGKRLWHSDDATAPHIIVGDRVIARAESAGEPGVLQLVHLDLHSGRNIRSSQVPLPQWVQIGQGGRDEFTYNVHAEGDVLVIEWEAHARYKGGAAPPRHVLEAARKDASGVARVDLDTGAVRVTDGDEEGQEGAALEAATPPPFTPEHPSIVQGRAYYVTRTSTGEKMLCARDLQSDELLWERALGSTRSSQPPPLPR
jgi:hypothetical protein